jgi:hypothetical protein
MIISRLGKITALGDAVDNGSLPIAPSVSDKIFTFFEADAGIAVGAPVQLQTDVNNNSTGNTYGFEVVEADTNSAGGGSGTIVGGYTGVNLTNPQGTKVNVNIANAAGDDGNGGAVVLTGVAAVDGDLIQVQCYGAGFCLGEGSTDIVAGDSLITDTTGGRCITVTDLADGSGGLITALGPLTEAAEGLIPVFFRCM